MGKPKGQADPPLGKNKPVRSITKNKKRKLAQEGSEEVVDTSDAYMELSDSGQNIQIQPIILSPPSETLTFSLLKSLFDENFLKLEGRFNSLDKSINSQNQEIVELKEEVSLLQNKVQQVTEEKDQLWKEINRTNLIISGVFEKDSESIDDLYDSVYNLLKLVTGREINFDTAFRIGKHRSTGPRPIKVRFISMFQRNDVYSSRSKSPRNVFINEDLPYAIRLDNGVLRNKKKELLEQGYQASDVKVDWKRKCVQTYDSCFKVTEGEVLEITRNSSNTTVIPSNNSSNPNKPKILPKNKPTNGGATSSLGPQQYYTNQNHNDIQRSGTNK